MKRAPDTIREEARELPVAGAFDVVVCGGGPAGVAAAIAAGRSGARTLLLDTAGCLGGTWTAGCLTWSIDGQEKPGLMREIFAGLAARGGRPEPIHWGCAFDPEIMKRMLEEMCLAAGVRVRLHTRCVAAVRSEDKGIAAVITESKSGREAWRARQFVDATGDGDVAAAAGCGFDVGRPEDGKTQPMSLLALFSGVRLEAIQECVRMPGGKGDKDRLLALMQEAGLSPSYSHPTIFHIRDELFFLMANHQYGAKAFDADQITDATLSGRREIHEQIAALRRLGGAWKDLYLVATGEQIGVREGRRIHGLYTVSTEDLAQGARFPDAVCRCTFCVDVHALDAHGQKGCSHCGIKAKPYDIPFRSLVARDVENLLLAGRCISGDFLAHSSYRVTGNAVAMGEAAGAGAAVAAATSTPPHALAWPAVQERLAAVSPAVRT